MKRSEMVTHMMKFLNELHALPDVDSLTEEDLVSLLLSKIETIGMKPPKYFTVSPHSISGTFGTYRDEWEPEDEA